MKKIVIVFLLGLVFSNLFGYKEHYFLTNKTRVEDVKSALILNQKWVKYPNYNDRAAWDQFLGEYKEQYIEDGQKYLDYQWQHVLATHYLEFQRGGSRTLMQTPFSQNRKALSTLFMAELAEGKGRFLDQIINGVFLFCEMTSWSLSAHLVAQPGGTSLPNYKHNYIDLSAGDIGANLSWIHYFLSPEFDKVNPLISERLHFELKKRILDSYLESTYFWWLSTNYKEGQLVNNHNPWCNSNCLLTFMLIENDSERLAKAVHKSMASVDKFMNYTKEDGACEEGPAYWGHAGGKMYDYLEMLSKITAGKISIFNEPMVKRIGEYIARSYVGDGWVVNFADAGPKGGGDPNHVYRFGKAVNSKEMMGYAIHRKLALDKNPGCGDFFRVFESIATIDEIKKSKIPYKPSPYTWYPQTEFCYMQNDHGMFFAGKGGYNDESHNHNDVGSFMLYVDNTPIFIDAGNPIYTSKTFSKDRYKIWNMQSDYHNLPIINGESQQYGKKYKATNISFDSKRKKFTIDISKAYGEKANVDKWERVYKLEKGVLKIEDSFFIEDAKESNVINFMTWGDVDISSPGVVLVEVQDKKVSLKYDSKLFKPSIEIIKYNGSNMPKIWGEIHRISLTATKIVDNGKYSFVCNKIIK